MRDDTSREAAIGLISPSFGVSSYACLHNRAEVIVCHDAARSRRLDRNCLAERGSLAVDFGV